MGQSIISLSLQNTTPIAQPISVFNPLPQQISNASGNENQTLYVYDVANEIANAIANNFTWIAVIYSVNGGNYSQKEFNYNTVINSAQTFVNALNSLNQSKFFVSGTNQISCYSIAPNGDSYYYSSLSANNNFSLTTFVGSTSYNNLGSVIYNQGFNSSNGTGILSRINTSNAWWINSVPNTTGGAFNRVGIQSSVVPPITTGVSIFGNVVAPTTGIYYIGFSCNISNNPLVQIYVNNNIVLNAIPYNCATNINSQLGTSTTTSLVFSNIWSIYPINLTNGNNFIILVFSYGNLTFSPLSLGVEVYNNTAAQIASATSYSDLNILFTTSGY